MTFLSPDTNL